MTKTRRAKRESTYSVRIDEQGIEFDLNGPVTRMNWSDMKSIKAVEDPDDCDVIFKSKHKSFRYEQWLEDEELFKKEVKKYFPAAKF